MVSVHMSVLGAHVRLWSIASHCIGVGVWPPMRGMASHLEYGLPYRGRCVATHRLGGGKEEGNGPPSMYIRGGLSGPTCVILTPIC